MAYCGPMMAESRFTDPCHWPEPPPRRRRGSWVAITVVETPEEAPSQLPNTSTAFRYTFISLCSARPSPSARRHSRISSQRLVSKHQMEESHHAAAMLAQSWSWSTPIGSTLAAALIVTTVVLLVLSLWFISSSSDGNGARRSAAAGGIAPLPSGSASPKPPSSSKFGDVYCPPTTLPLLGNLFDMIQQGGTFHDWLAELAQRSNGRPVRLTLPGKPDLLVLSTSAQFETVQKHLLDNFVKGPSFHDLLFDLMGDGIFAVNGDKWKRQRQILVRLSTARSLRDHIAPIIRKNTRTLLSILDRAAVRAGEGEATRSTPASPVGLDLFELMQQLTLDTFVELAFGVKLGGLASTEQAQGQQHTSEADGHAFQRALDEAQFLVAKRFLEPTAVWKLKRWLNFGTERRLRDSMDVVNGMAYDLISKSIALRQQPQPTASTEARAPDQQKHLVDLLLDVADADGLDVTPTQVRDMVVNALVAGRDTTAETLSWSFHLLHQHPRVVAALRDELTSRSAAVRTSRTSRPWTTCRLCHTSRPRCARSCGCIRRPPSRSSTASRTRGCSPATRTSTRAEHIRSCGYGRRRVSIRDGPTAARVGSGRRPVPARAVPGRKHRQAAARVAIPIQRLQRRPARVRRPGARDAAGQARARGRAVALRHLRTPRTGGDVHVGHHATHEEPAARASHAVLVKEYSYFRAWFPSNSMTIVMASRIGCVLGSVAALTRQHTALAHRSEQPSSLTASNMAYTGWGFYSLEERRWRRSRELSACSRASKKRLRVLLTQLLLCSNPWPS